MSRTGRALCLLVVLLASPARASLLDAYGFGPRETAMGNAATAPSEDYAAVFYNPANLIARKAVHFGYGLNWVSPLLSIDRRALQSEFESVVPDDNLGLHVGVSVPLGGVFDEKVAFGAALVLPLLRLTRVESIDYHVPQFLLYQNVPDKLALLLGLAYEPIPELRIGIGLQILAELQGAARVSLSLLDNKVTSRDIRLDVFGTASPTAGVTVLPIPELRIAVSYRGELSLDYALPVQVLIEEIGTLSFEVSGVSLYTPHQLSLGASLDLPHGLRLSAELAWSMWSLAPSPAARVNLDLDDSVLVSEHPGSDVHDLISVDSPTIAIGAKDIVSPRFGVEWVASDLFSLRGGYSYRPTPLPVPVNQANYLDAPAHTASVGGSVTFHDPLEHHKKPLTVGLVLQWTFLEARRVDKPEADDPVGDYTAGGSIMNLGVDFSHDF